MNLTVRSRRNIVHPPTLSVRSRQRFMSSFFRPIPSSSFSPPNKKNLSRPATILGYSSDNKPCLIIFLCVGAWVVLFSFREGTCLLLFGKFRFSCSDVPAELSEMQNGTRNNSIVRFPFCCTRRALCKMPRLKKMTSLHSTGDLSLCSICNRLFSCPSPTGADSHS